MQKPRPTRSTARGRAWAIACGLLLALLTLPAFALGLGQIEVKSRSGEPLLAEIPIISADPSELENLQARLASPDTFRRIGLEPPTGLVSGLRFAVALDAQGRPVIRITSDVPVQQPMLTFLVEVDWGQGRLVREYSALVDTPQTVAAPAQPPIQAPQAAPSNVITRPPEVATTDPPGAEPDATSEPDVAEADEPQAVAAEDPPPPTPAPASAPVAMPTAAAPGTPGEYGPVQAGQTLGEIAASLSTGSGHSLNQVMLALLRANPEAFIGGNVNLVRQGAVLRVPPTDAWSDTSIAEANAVVREHVSRWREMRRPVAQPDAVAEAGEGATPATGERAPAAGAQGAGRIAEARLEIVPPSSGGGQEAGTRTGTAAGGEGDMLQQQELVQTRETLAARDAEVQELKTRLAELEQLQQQQQQLIQMKDSELAAAQQRLAQSNAEPATGTSAQTGAGTPADTGAGLPWLWIGLGLVAAALLAAWLVSRRKGEARERKPSYGFASAASKAPVKSETAVPVAVLAPEQATGPEPEPLVAAAPAPGNPGSTWQAAPAAAAGTSPTWHAAGDEGAQGAAVAPLNPAPAGQERIELARAYIDLGDTDTARSLLQEVADSGDAGARGEAQRLLRELA
ncbi:ferrous iron transporter B [Luteimonas viscosa]|uniref:Ferrous iron transporter B n=1 Tax=Luteimonas viscosa TaxID=1132694 RepID=A0A5D4XME8_9GAMM|nr:FimV/HubP family polar landmark protein [Luteimonas viscosa]TYT25135.1 ferrous iron transporter B [Luteimonas viscosa]